MIRMKINTNSIIGFYAMQNYGKTYGIKQLIAKIAPHSKVLIYDTDFEGNSYIRGLPPEAAKNVFYVRAKNKSDQTDGEWVSRMLIDIRAQYSNCFIIFEDIDKLTDAHHSKALKEIYQLASDSRHQRIGVIYATKEPVNIPVKLRSCTNLFFIGQFLEPAHLKTLAGFVDKEEIKKLKPPQFIRIDRLQHTSDVVQFTDGGQITTLKTLKVD